MSSKVGSECKNSYEEINKTAKHLLERTKHRPRIGIICGSGLGGLGNQLESKDIFNYEDIPNFPVSTVQGHQGRLVVGTLSGVPVICMQGRFHLYEGFQLSEATMPIRVMKLMGVTKLIVTNAAGGVNTDYVQGDIMIIKDHINLPGFAGLSPLSGKNEERFGPRFPALADCYNDIYRQKAKGIAVKIGIPDLIREGIYVSLGGPTYETVAECRMLRSCGADAVGMSTVHEVVVARHCDMKVFAISLITNMVVDNYDTEETPNHEEVLAMANKRTESVQKMITEMVKEMDTI